MAYYSWGVFQVIDKQPSIPQLVDSTKVWIITIGVVFLVPMFLFNSGSMGTAPTASKDILNTNTPVAVVQGNMENNDGLPKYSAEELLAKCVTNNNVRMFGSRHCGACMNQKAKFGDAFHYIHFRDCADDSTPCKEHKVEGYPTWIQFEGDKDDTPEIKRVRGVQSLSALATFSGCSYES